jgi:hypothetical protein
MRKILSDDADIVAMPRQHCLHCIVLVPVDLSVVLSTLNLSTLLLINIST